MKFSFMLLVLALPLFAKAETKPIVRKIASQDAAKLLQDAKGKLIRIHLNGFSFAVELPDGSDIDYGSQDDYVVVANKVCDLSKPFTGGPTIFYIAK